MFYILWAILNLGIFIFILSKGFTYFRKKLGSIAALFFVFGLFAFAGDSDSGEQSIKKSWAFSSEDSLANNSTAFIEIDLEKTLISKYRLGIGYGRDRQTQKNIPLNATSWTTGIISGASWKPLSIIITQTNDDQNFEYNVDGLIKWRVLGITVYSQPKHWKGVVVVK
jgi:hypothetical protein